MKALAWILLGLVIGSFATVSALNALRPATAFPKGVMALFQHHLGEANKSIAAKQCNASLSRHFEALGLLAEDIRPAFSDLATADEHFANYADKLVATTTAARAADLTDCTVATEFLGQIKDGCKACHREYK